ADEPRGRREADARAEGLAGGDARHEHGERRTEAEQRADAEEVERRAGSAHPGGRQLAGERAVTTTDPVVAECRERRLQEAALVGLGGRRGLGLGPTL